MLGRTVFAVLAMVLLTAPLKAKDCPVETRVEGTLEAKEEAIRKAATCKAAYEIMEVCAYTASGDTGLACVTGVTRLSRPVTLSATRTRIPELPRPAARRLYCRVRLLSAANSAKTANAHTGRNESMISPQGGSCRAKAG